MFEDKRTQDSAEDLMRLQRKILGSENSSVYRGRKKKINGNKSKIKVLFNEKEQKTR
jgi:hypothetical protein